MTNGFHIEGEVSIFLDGKENIYSFNRQTTRRDTKELERIIRECFLPIIENEKRERK